MAALSEKDELKIAYEHACSSIETAKDLEKADDLVQCKQYYVKGIQQFMSIVHRETDVSKKEMIKQSIASFLDKTEEIQRRISNELLEPGRDSVQEPGSNAIAISHKAKPKNKLDVPARHHKQKRKLAVPQHKEVAASRSADEAISDDNHPDLDAQNLLTDMGFDAESARAALVANDGDVDRAAQCLIDSDRPKSARKSLPPKPSRSRQKKVGKHSVSDRLYSSGNKARPVGARRKKVRSEDHSVSNRRKDKKSAQERRIGYKPSKPKPKKETLSKQEQEIREKLCCNIIDTSNASSVSFKQVQGLKNVKLALYETIILPGKRPDIFTGLREPTSGLLLFGPPGNGKTLVAKCVASECKATFFNISASSITSKWVGEGEKFMKSLFKLAEEKADKGKLSIIFIDEIDSLLTARGGKNEAESSRRIKTEFLVQFDGVKKKSQQNRRILVIGATNLPWQLDDAVLRRFGKRICVPLPDFATRQGLLRMLLEQQGQHSLSDSQISRVAQITQGYSCSDMTVLCKDAAMGPVRELGSAIEDLKANQMPSIEQRHFESSLQNVRPSTNESSLKRFEQWNTKYGSIINLNNFELPDCMKPDKN